MPCSGYGERSRRRCASPASTKSFVLLMEDPDAKTPRPYVHWLLYNVPAETTQLPESVPRPLDSRSRRAPSRDEIHEDKSGTSDRGHPKAIHRTTTTFKSLRSTRC